MKKNTSDSIENKKPGRNRLGRERLSEALTGYLFLLPFLIFYLVYNFYPLVNGFIISLYKWNITGNKTFIALDNYNSLLNDSNFIQALKNTIMYVGVSTPIFMAGALLFGMLIDAKFLRGKTFVRSVLFLPNILAVSIVAIIWLNMLQPYTGFINSMLNRFGMEKEMLWLSNHELVWPVIIGVTFWWNTGYYMLIYLAGLQNVPEELYEAASIDGANGFKRFLYIMLPSLKATHLLVLFLQVIASFKIFGQVFLITGGGPGGASRTLLQYIYEVGFTTFLLGKASAASFVLLVIILAVSMVQLRIMRHAEGGAL